MSNARVDGCAETQTSPRTLLRKLSRGYSKRNEAVGMKPATVMRFPGYWESPGDALPRNLGRGEDSLIPFRESKSVW